MVFSICGVTSMDMVARSCWSRSRSARKDSSRPGPATPRSWRRFFTQWARCHSTDSHSAVVTCDQPGNRRQSGPGSAARPEANGGSAEAMRGAVLGVVADRGRMQTGVTGSGGMLTGVVEEAGPDSPLGLAAGDRIASLVSLSLTPLAVTDGLARWDGQSEQVPCAGHAILFGRSIAAVLPADLPAALALAVMDVCGAPALTERVVRESAARRGPGAPGVVPWEGGSAGRGGPAEPGPVVPTLGAGGRGGPLSWAAARRAGAGTVIGVVPAEAEAAAVRRAGLADQVVVADARDPVALADAVRSA